MDMTATKARSLKAGAVQVLLDDFASDIKYAASRGAKSCKVCVPGELDTDTFKNVCAAMAKRGFKMNHSHVDDDGDRIEVVSWA